MPWSAKRGTGRADYPGITCYWLRRCRVCGRVFRDNTRNGSKRSCSTAHTTQYNNARRKRPNA